MRAVVLLCAVALTGCAIEEHAPGISGDFVSLPFEETADGPCTDGATRACSVEIGRNADIVSCFTSSQSCTGGGWSACGADGGGTLESKGIVRSDATSTTKSLS